jgi:DNA adenine methylase
MSDYDEYLVAMWKAVQDGWEPPTYVSEDMYRDVRASMGTGKYDMATTAFVGYACSFAAKWWGGYARNKENTNYALIGARAIDKKRHLFTGMEFHHTSYGTWDIENALIYCDPPYADTTVGYRLKSFDTVLFWRQVDTWRRNNNIVVVSEFKAPSWVPEPALSFEIRSSMNTVGVARNKEKAFYYTDNCYLIY